MISFGTASAGICSRPVLGSFRMGRVSGLVLRVDPDATDEPRVTATLSTTLAASPLLLLLALGGAAGVGAVSASAAGLFCASPARRLAAKASSFFFASSIHGNMVDGSTTVFDTRSLLDSLLGPLLVSLLVLVLVLVLVLLLLLLLMLLFSCGFGQGVRAVSVPAIARKSCVGVNPRFCVYLSPPCRYLSRIPSFSACVARTAKSRLFHRPGMIRRNLHDIFFFGCPSLHPPAEPPHSRHGQRSAIPTKNETCKSRREKFSTAILLASINDPHATKIYS